MHSIKAGTGEPAYAWAYAPDDPLSTTNEPQPGVVTIRPSSRSEASTLRAVVLAIPNSWWMVTIDGTIAPGGSSPDRMRLRSSSLTWIHGGMWPSRSDMSGPYPAVTNPYPLQRALARYTVSWHDASVTSPDDEHRQALGHHAGQAPTDPGADTPRHSVPASLPQFDDLPILRQQFPGFEIWREVTGDRTRYIARRRHTWLSPHTVVTADPDELRAALSQDEYPQAIADDYPGWGVEHQDGQWTAWCPAITVHADTAYGLRAAIEHAIDGGNQQ